MERSSVMYHYGNMPIPGGGYVSGFAFHNKQENILYAKTDIGGVYRYDFEHDLWISLVEHVCHYDQSETFPLALALDDNHPERLYVICGVGHPEPVPNGFLCVSEDFGDTFTRYELPCVAHGNDPSRGTGMRLVVDPNDSNTLYFASQTYGLLKTQDRGKTWSVLNVATKTHPQPEQNLAFVFVGPDSRTIVVATAGIDNNLSDSVRGHSLYLSNNAGETFADLWQPKVYPGDYAGIFGYVGHRYAFDGTYLYITLNHSGKYCWIQWPGYSCDAGNVTGGKLIRFEYLDGQMKNPTDITPHFPDYQIYNDSCCDCGFGGVSTCDANPGYLLLSTLCRRDGDLVFESKDYGATWKIKLYNLEIGNISFNASYMKPKYNGNSSLVHWMSDIRYNPFDPNMAVFNTGSGVFMSKNLQQSDWSWEDHCKGIEETVHLNVYAPTGGKTKLLDIVGDLGGFAFTEIGQECENSFEDENHDRYITSINADYVDADPEFCVCTPRGNWTGKTKGGLVVSHNGCQTLTRPELPFGLSEHLDELLERICHPNNNSGWASISADGHTIVWSVAEGGALPVDCVVVTHDEGKSYQLCSVLDIYGAPVTGISFKTFSDRLESSLFYGFGPDSRLFVSKDCGETFHEYAHPRKFPVQTLCNIDAANAVEIRGIAGVVGEFLFAMGTDGLWKLRFDPKLDVFFCTRISADGDTVYCAGLGILPKAADYIHSDKAIYICGILNGQFGFFRSYDNGVTWVRINNDRQCFGEIKSIDGDKRVPGRYFIATGTRGVKYGEEVQ